MFLSQGLRKLAGSAMVEQARVCNERTENPRTSSKAHLSFG